MFSSMALILARLIKFSSIDSVNFFLAKFYTWQHVYTCTRVAEILHLNGNVVNFDYSHQSNGPKTVATQAIATTLPNTASSRVCRSVTSLAQETATVPNAKSRASGQA